MFRNAIYSFILVLASPCFSSANIIGVTEFLNNVNGTGGDSSLEWVELFNFGLNDVNLNGWTITDEDTNSFVISESFTIEAGEFAILAINKTAFLSNWSGLNADQVLDINSFVLANGADEIVLKDGDANTIWSLAYSDDESDGVATFLTATSPSVSIFGSKVDPGVDRNGDDNGNVGFLGYQSNDATTDLDAFAGSNGDFGSPLAGAFSQVPEPGSILVWSFLLTSNLMSRRRRV